VENPEPTAYSRPIYPGAPATPDKHPLVSHLVMVRSEGLQQRSNRWNPIRRGGRGRRRRRRRREEEEEE